VHIIVTAPFHKNGRNNATNKGNVAHWGVSHKYYSKKAQAHYAKMEPLWTRLWAEEKEGMKANEDTLHADWAKLDTEQEKWKVDIIKAYEKQTVEQKAARERREAERKVYEKMMVKRKADKEDLQNERNDEC
jgi:hypothetical protein